MPDNPQRYWTEENRKEDCAEIFARMIAGESLTQILKDDHLPHVKSFMGWLHKDDKLMQEYRTAQMLRAEIQVDEICEIADNLQHDLHESEHVTPEGDVVTIKKYDTVKQKQRQLQIDTRKWTASKMIPKIFGDKIQQEVTTMEPINVSVKIKRD